MSDKKLATIADLRRACRARETKQVNVCIGRWQTAMTKTAFLRTLGGLPATERAYASLRVTEHGTHVVDFWGIF